MYTKKTLKDINGWFRHSMAILINQDNNIDITITINKLIYHNLCLSNRSFLFIRQF